MGTRKIVTIGDDGLRKVCRPQDRFDRRLATLLKDMAETADQVLCSHSHMDHHGIDNVKIEEKRIDTPFKLDIIKTFHDDREGALRGPNDITVLESDGFKIVHMGDVGCMIDEDDLLKIKGCDVLMIPVGGFFTIDGKEAAKYVGKIAPKAVIPMHYRGDAFGYSEIGTVDLFLEYVGYPVVPCIPPMVFLYVT